MDEAEERKIYQRLQGHYTQTEDNKEYAWTHPQFYDMEHGPFAVTKERRLLYERKLEMVQKAFMFIAKNDLYWFKGKKIIDVGAGTGAMSVPLATWGAKVTTIDRDPGFSEVANGKLSYLGGQGMPANAGSLPFEDGAYDAVMTTNFWDTGTITMEKREEFIREMMRVSKPNAHFVTLVRNGDNPLMKKMDYGTFTYKENKEMHARLDMDLLWYDTFSIPSPWPGKKGLAVKLSQKIPGKKFKGMAIFVSRKKK